MKKWKEGRKCERKEIEKRRKECKRDRTKGEEESLVKCVYVLVRRNV